MSNGIEKYQPPTQIVELDLWAKRLYESGMFKDVKDVAEAFVKVTAGAELGLSPSQSMRGVHVIQGKTIIGAGLLSSLLDRPPYDFTTKYEPNIQNPTSCTITVYKNGVERGQSHFSLDDAKRAGLLKGGGNWEKYPSDMLFARAVSQAARRYAAGALGGAVYVEAHGEYEIQPDTPTHATAKPRTRVTAEVITDAEVEFDPATEPAPPVVTPPASPVVPAGELRKALAALNPHQREVLFAACDLDPEAKTPLGEIRDAMKTKWREFGLPPFEGEPVPVTLLGAIYGTQKGSAEAFDIFARTGQDIDEGDQVEFDEVMT